MQHGHLQELKSLHDKIFFSHFYSSCVSYSLTLYFTVLLLECVCVYVCVCAGADCETDEWPAMADS